MLPSVLDLSRESARFGLIRVRVLEMSNLNLKIIPGVYAVVKLPAGTKVPSWGLDGSLWSVTATDEEVSIVCEESRVPPEHDEVERGWGIIKISGPLDFALTGILSSLTQLLAAAKISIFAVSTFNTDYLLVKAENLSLAKSVLAKAGHVFVEQ